MKSGASGVDQSGVWNRQGPYHWSGPGGCLVSACRVGPVLGAEASDDMVAAAWRFTAWGPEAMPELSYWQWRSAANLPGRYEPGQATPQRRPWLGVFLTAEEARAACLAWLAGVGAAMSVATAEEAD